jgi:hypothetical protein
LAARRAAAALSSVAPTCRFPARIRETRPMPHPRLPDCRPPRRDDSVTSASSHPELLTGEIVMRPRIHHLLSPAERDVLSSWRRGVFAVYALLAAAIIGYSMLTPETRTVAHGVSKDEQARAEPCVRQTGSLPDAADRKASKQDATRETMPNAMPTCAPDDPARVGRASTRQPQAN